MTKIERLRIELAVLLMISLVTLGGFMSLGISDDSGDELTGEFKIKIDPPSKKCKTSGGTWIAGRGRAKCHCPQNKVLEKNICVVKSKSITLPVLPLPSKTVTRSPVQTPQKQCRIDISNCHNKLKSKFYLPLLFGTPMKDPQGVSACLIDNVRNPNEKQYIPLYYKYGDPYDSCKIILQRE